MQPDRRRSAALRRPVPASAGGPSQSSGWFGAPRDVLVPGQGGVAYRDSRPPSDAEAPAPPSEGGGQEAPGGSGGPAAPTGPAGPGQPQGAPPHGPGPYGAPPPGGPNGQGGPYGQVPQDAPPQGPPPQGPQGSPGDGGGQGGQQDGGQGNGQGGQDNGQGGQGNGQNGGQDQPPPWGNQWSSHQPPPGHGSWGGGDPGQPGPGGPGGPQGPGGSGDGPGPDRDNGRDNGRGNGEGPGGNLRWDPTDPVQRRSRYALLAGMWGFFFALFNWWPLALLLGALALYWGIEALRGKSRAPGGAAAGNGRGNAPGNGAGGGNGGTDAFGQPVQRQAKGGRPHMTAAIIGIVTAGITLSIVLIGFSVQIAYRDYFNCRSDALTEASKEHCSNELPKPLRTFFERD
ncbi:hypothetical protein GCM10010400_53710 [Streptomyces aculeolatus]